MKKRNELFQTCGPVQFMTGTVWRNCKSKYILIAIDCSSLRLIDRKVGIGYYAPKSEHYDFEQC